MEEWTIFEVHRIDGELTKSEVDKYTEVVEKSSGYILESNSRRVVGKIDKCGQYPDSCRIKSMTEGENIIIILCSARNQLASTLIFTEGEREEKFVDEYQCQDAIHWLIKEYDIRTYIQEEWNRIECSASVISDEGFETELDGYLTIGGSKASDAQLRVNVSGEDEIAAELDEHEIRQIIRKLKVELGGYKGHESMS